MNHLRKIFSRLACGSMLGAAVFSMLALPVAAYGVTTYGSGPCEVTSSMGWRRASVKLLKWSKVSTQTISTKYKEDISALNSGIAYVDNNLGAVMLKIPGKDLPGNIDYEQMTAAPIVMAFYDPQSDVGTIWVDRAIRTAKGNLLVEQMPFAPQDGVVMSAGYDHNNPFWQFVQGRNGNPTVKNPASFVKINGSAFEAAVGMVLRQFNAQRGLIATLGLSHKLTKSSSGGLFRRTVTQTVHYYAHPTWTLVLPSGEAPGGYTAGYTLPICSPGNDKPATASSSAGAKRLARIWSGNQTEAGLSSIKYHGQWWAALKVPAGVEYINQGAKPLGLNTSKWPIYTYSKSKSGFSLVFIALMSIVLDYFAGGALTSLLNASSSTASLGLAQMGLNTASAGAEAGAGLGAVTNLLVDTGCFGLCGKGQSASGAYSFGGGPGASMGGFGKQQHGHLNITTFSMSKYLAELQSASYTSGVGTAKHSTNPTSPSSGVNGVVGAETNAVTANQLQAPGSIGSQANTASRNSAAAAANTPDSITKQYVNGTATNPYGALPPAP